LDSFLILETSAKILRTAVSIYELAENETKAGEHSFKKAFEVSAVAFAPRLRSGTRKGFDKPDCSERRNLRMKEL
jgi:hypothetical protein